jgi:hypothetical protein
MSDDAGHDRNLMGRPLILPFGLELAIRCILPPPPIVPVMSYAGETEDEALIRCGMATMSKNNVQFVHLD